MYEVGQVLYVLMTKEHTVIPVRVVEKILRRTIEGESISHIVELPTPSQNQVDLDKLGPGIYSSSSDAMSAMIENASSTIADIVKKAEHIAQSVFDVKLPTNRSTDIIDEVSMPMQHSESDYQVQTPIEMGENIEVDLGHGIKGKINLTNMETQ